MDLNLTLSVEHVNAILNALGDAPYKLSAPVITAIQMQAQQQMMEAAAASHQGNGAIPPNGPPIIPGQESNAAD